jgi:Zn-dependent protease with chaperone function
MQSMAKNWKLWLLVVLLPLVMAAASWFEGNRMAGHTVNAAQVAQIQDIVTKKRERADALDARADTLDATGNPQIVGGNGNGTLMTQALALRKQAKALREETKKLEGLSARSTGVLSQNNIKLVGWVGVALALMALIVGVYILLQAHQWQAAAQRARDSLLAAFERSQARMPKLLTGFMLLLAGTAAALATLEGIELWQAFYGSGRVGSGFFKIHAGAIVVALGIVYGAFTAARELNAAFKHDEEAMPVQGRTLSRAEAPGLWAAVDAAAQKLGTASPQHIIVGMEDGFYVTEGAIELAPSNQSLKGQTLYLCATRMAVLSPEEILSIIGHELGHFAGEDTAYSRRFSPLYAKAVRSHIILGNALTGEWTDYLSTKPAFMLNEYVLDAFHLAIRHWSRVREFAADQAGKTVAGAVDAASALLRYSATEPVLVSHYKDLSSAPSDVQALTRLLQTSAQNSQLAPPAVEEEIPHPTDTHPPTAERVQALVGESSALLEAARAQAHRPVDSTGATWLRTVIPQFDDVYHQLATEHIVQYKADTAAHQAALQEVLQNVNQLGDTVVRDKKGWVMMALTILLLVGTVGVWAWFLFSDSRQFGSTEKLLLGAVVLLLPATFGAMTWAMRRRHHRALCTLSPTSIQSDAFTRPLAWTEIENYEAQEVNGVLLLTLHLTLTTPFALHNRSLMRLSYNAKKQNLVMKLSSIDGMTNTEFFDRFNNYYRAVWAKIALQEMDGAEG